jgi:hypothetical protein
MRPEYDQDRETNLGKISSPLPAKLFVGILTSLPETISDIIESLSTRLGPSDARSAAFAFDMTHYYDDEMGSPIVRLFLGFRDLIVPDRIPAIKVTTNELEAAFAASCGNVRRPVNLDPGYLEESKIVLASTKNFYHRILLAGGIYGEVTLHYSGGSWKSFPWSFPDFRSGRDDEFFTQLRRRYREQLAAQGFRP